MTADEYRDWAEEVGRKRNRPLPKRDIISTKDAWERFRKLGVADIAALLARLMADDEDRLERILAMGERWEELHKKESPSSSDEEERDRLATSIRNVASWDEDARRRGDVLEVLLDRLLYGYGTEFRPPSWEELTTGERESLAYRPYDDESEFTEIPIINGAKLWLRRDAKWNPYLKFIANRYYEIVSRSSLTQPKIAMKIAGLLEKEFRIDASTFGKEQLARVLDVHRELQRKRNGK